MESKNLNDIVIDDTDSSKKAQLKNILTLLALLFIILVISIVITKLILGSDEDSNNTTSLSSETTTQTENVGNGLSTAATVATGVAAGVATAAIANSSSSDSKKEATTTTTLLDRNSSSSKKLPLRDHQPKKNLTHRTHTTTKSITKHVVKHRNEYHPTKKKEVVHKALVKHTPVKATTKGYYIKVGAFKDPSTAIKKIKANHLKYRTENTKNGISTRVYVGPYYSQKDAQKDMAKVRANIAKDAFITKL